MIASPAEAPKADAPIPYGKPAVLRVETNPRLRNNLLVQALPELLSDEDTYAKLLHMPPPRPPDFFSWPLQYRIEAIRDLFEVFVPEQSHQEAWTHLHCAIRCSYESRDPSSPDVQRFLYELSVTNIPSLLPRRTVTGGGSAGIMIVGTTGVGKTTFIDRFVEFLGGPREHRVLNGKPCLWFQIPAVRIQVMETKSIKGIAEAICSQIDAMTGSRSREGLRRAAGRGAILAYVCRMLTSMMVGALLVEDLQLLKNSGSSATEILDFLANIMEITGIPMVGITTFKVKQLFQSHTAVGSKLYSGGELQMLPLRPGEELDRLIIVFWSLRVNRSGELPKWLSKFVYQWTGGIRRLIREFFQRLFEKMARDDIAVLDKATALECAKQSVGRFSSAVRAVLLAHAGVSIDPDELSAYEDLLDTALHTKGALSPLQRMSAEEREKLKTVDDKPTETNSDASRPSASVKPKKSKAVPSRSTQSSSPQNTEHVAPVATNGAFEGGISQAIEDLAKGKTP